MTTVIEILAAEKSIRTIFWFWQPANDLTGGGGSRSGRWSDEVTVLGPLQALRRHCLIPFSVFRHHRRAESFLRLPAAAAAAAASKLMTMMRAQP